MGGGVNLQILATKILALSTRTSTREVNTVVKQKRELLLCKKIIVINLEVKCEYLPTICLRTCAMV